MTRAKLSKEIGIGRSTMRMYETRGSLPSAEVLYKIAKLMNVSMESLIDEKEDDYPADIRRIISMLPIIPEEMRGGIEANVRFMYEKEIEKKSAGAETG